MTSFFNDGAQIVGRQWMSWKTGPGHYFTLLHIKSENNSEGKSCNGAQSSFSTLGAPPLWFCHQPRIRDLWFCQLRIRDGVSPFLQDQGHWGVTVAIQRASLTWDWDFQISISRFIKQDAVDSFYEQFCRVIWPRTHCLSGSGDLGLVLAWSAFWIKFLTCVLLHSQSAILCALTGSIPAGCVGQ